MAQAAPSIFHTEILGNTSFTIPGRYKKLKFIGSGSQGVVCSAFDTETRNRVAIKKLSSPFQDVHTAKCTYRELRLMRLMNHRNVMGLLDVFTPQTSFEEFSELYLVMELMDCPLYQRMNRLDHQRISFLLYQLLCGLKHLHSGQIIHRDLKSSNIAVNKDYSLKILDFGLARTAINSNMTPEVVTFHYRAPEVLLRMGYSEKLDIWSVGCIMGEMILRHPVFRGVNRPDQWCKIIDQLGSPSDDFVSRIPPDVRQHIEHLPRQPGHSFEELFPDSLFTGDNEDLHLTAASARDLLSRMLVIDPLHRISVAEALEHEYIRCWHDEIEVNGPPPRINEPPIDEVNRSLLQWKRLIFQEAQRD